MTGGERQTDSFEVFPKIEKQTDDSFVCRFFLHGLRHVSDAAQHRVTSLKPGEVLGVSLELNNPKYGLAIQLTSQDYEFIGWTPRFIVGDLLNAINKNPRLKATVVQVNADGVPLNHRVLVDLRGYLPSGVEPMTGGDFLPICETHPAQ